MKDLAGRVAVITGGGGGIGEGLAQAAADAGMKVVIADIEAENAERVAAAIREGGEGGGSAIGVGCDVSDAKAVDALAEATYREFGAAHLLCNNAGVLMHGALVDSTDDDWRWMLGVNVLGVIHGVRAFVPRMRAQGGEAHIVNTGSLASLLPLANTGLYNVTKYSVLAISEVLREELAADRIGVSVLCPAGVDTQINQAGRNRPDPLGGPESVPEAPTVAEEVRDRKFDAALAEVFTPARVAEIVLDAVRANDLYIPTHPAWKDTVASRFDSILESFETTRERRA